MNANRVFMMFLVLLAIVLRAAAPTLAQEKNPNIVVIMGDGIGMWNIGAYHRGMMSGRTPNRGRQGHGTRRGFRTAAGRIP